MRLAIPSSLSGFTIHQVKRITDLISEHKLTKESNSISVELMHEFVSACSGVRIDDLLEAKQSDIKKVFNVAVGAFTTYEKKDPPKTIEIQGKTYHLMDLQDQKGGWYVDVKVMAEDFKSQPELLPALNYIEEEEYKRWLFFKGKRPMKYSQKDENGKTINPITERAEIFREHFPGDVFLDLSGFFFDKSEILIKVFSEIGLQQARMEIQKAREIIASSIGSD